MPRYEIEYVVGTRFVTTVEASSIDDAVRMAESDDPGGEAVGDGCFIVSVLPGVQA